MTGTNPQPPAAGAAALLSPQIRIRPGEYRPLIEGSAAVRDRLAVASDVVGQDLVQALLTGADEEINQGTTARPAIVAMSVGCYQDWVTEPVDYLAGVSLGQLTAAHLAGCLSFADTIRMAHTMARIEAEEFGDSEYGVYFFAQVDLDQLQAAAAELTESGHYLRPCAFLADDQMIMTGTTTGLGQLAAAAFRLGGVGVVIPYGPPAHCDLMVDVQRRFAAEWTPQDPVHDPVTPLVCNLTTEPLRTRDEVLHALVTQYTGTVRWSGSLRRMTELGVGRVLLPGPGGFLSRSLRSTSVPLKVENGPGVELVAPRPAGSGAPR